MLSTHTPASRARERGTATHSAAGARLAPPSTTAGGILTRRRRTGSATPVATRTQAVALMALRTRKGGEYMECPAWAWCCAALVAFATTDRAGIKARAF